MLFRSLPYEGVTIDAGGLANCMALGGSAGSRYLVVAGFASTQPDPGSLDWRLDAAGSGPLATSLRRTASIAAVPRADAEFELRRRAIERAAAGAVARDAVSAAPVPALGSLRQFTPKRAFTKSGTRVFKSEYGSRLGPVPIILCTRSPATYS